MPNIVYLVCQHQPHLVESGFQNVPLMTCQHTWSSAHARALTGKIAALYGRRRGLFSRG